MLYPLSYWGRCENYSIRLLLEKTNNLVSNLHKVVWLSGKNSDFFRVLVQAACGDRFLDLADGAGDLNLPRTCQGAVEDRMTAINTKLVVEDF